MRTLLLLAAPLVAGLLAWCFPPPLYDFVEYWAAGRLLVAGENPYDAEAVAELEKQAGRADDAILMWNPPWVLPFAAPIGPPDPRTGRALWLAVQLAALLLAADGLHRLHGGSERTRPVSWLVALSFAPSIVALGIGQITPLLPLGAWLFLHFVKRGQDLLAGMATALLSIKPHLCYLFWIAVLLWTLRTGRWRVIAGGVLAGLALAGVALLFNPHVVGQYFRKLTTDPPKEYDSPTLGSLLRLALGKERAGFRWQFLPMLLGLGWLAWAWPRLRERDWSEMLPPLLLASFITAPYGAWLFDAVLLLPALLAIPATRAAIRAWAVVTAITWAMLAARLAWRAPIGYLHFIWLAPALGAAYLFFRPALRNTNQPQSAGPCEGQPAALS
ncbi:MAG: DUF2029 domain-containing protein [Gemmataceae bacterium]|nr:DUF2029 domain-containing protein [Gemmataceae bacterium]